MSQLAKETQREPADLASRLRQLASELRAARTREQLHAVVGSAVRQLPGCDRFEFDPALERPAFESSRLTVPLVGSSGVLGSVHVGPPGKGRIHPGDLQLAGAVADLSAAVIDRCLQAGATTSAALLGAALDGLAAGVLCFDADGGLVFANNAAREQLQGRLPPRWSAWWNERVLPSPDGVLERPFVWRSGGRLIHVTFRRAAANAPGAIVLTDITPRVTTFSEQIAAECYRCLLEKRSLALGILAGAEGSPIALELLETAAATAGSRLPTGTRAGPVDAEAIGLVVPGVDAGSMRRLLVALGQHAGKGGALRYGVASLRLDGDSPQDFIARATSALEPLPAMILPEVFVFDRSPAVVEALALILRRDCAVAPVADRHVGLALLRERLFEGMILELPAQPESVELDWLKQALAAQPDARALFTSELPGPWELEEWGLPGAAPVFRKPFAVEKLRTAVRESLAAR